jgi:ABC-type sugar transport system permease subunit
MSLIITRFLLFISVSFTAMLSQTYANELDTEWLLYSDQHSLTQSATWTVWTYVFTALAILSFGWIIAAVVQTRRNRY